MLAGGTLKPAPSSWARADTDGDDLPDSDEAGIGPDPRSRDSDGDGLDDFTEVDASADAPDGRTVRLVALGILEALAGLALRAPAS